MSRRQGSAAPRRTGEGSRGEGGREAPSAGATVRSWGARIRRLAVKMFVVASLVSAGQAALLRVADPPLTLTMLEKAGLRWTHVPLGEMSPQLAREMAVAAEDTRFYDHSGFDLSSLRARAKECWRLNQRRAASGRARSFEGCKGASTLSQQTARNVFLMQAGGPVRKLAEAWYTVWLELLVSKERILQVYVDVAQLAPDAFGVEAGARRWFNQPASALTPAQMATLMSLLPCPNTCTPESALPRKLQPKILANWHARSN